jgi:hypothetical protein
MIPKILNVLLSFIFILLVLISPASAQSSTNFTTDLNAVYTISDSKSSEVVFDIVLTNTSDRHFPEFYQMNLGFDDISDLKARDGAGNIKTEIKKIPEGYSLKLFLNSKPIGRNSRTRITLSLKTASVIKNSGTAFEVNIPGISNPEEFEKFNVKVQTHESFGSPAYIKPYSRDLSFSKDTISKSGAVIGFGDKQSYKFSLRYHIVNPNFYPKDTEIALPSDTNYQKIYIESIKSHPNSVSVDRDGNWIAKYSLSPLGKKEVIVSGFAQISHVPEESDLSDEEKILYTKATRFWQTEDPEIKALSKELKTPEAIYSFVVEKLNYDIKRVEEKKPRLGAKKALSRPESAVCLEYTDLFIALMRSAGIPAREVNGFALTQNNSNRPLSLVSDVLHAWPQYYDEEKKAWIMADPTWGDTTGGVDYFQTFDFNHFAFVVKGIRDDYPIPAGGYKSKDEKTNKDIKDVSVEITNQKPSSKPKVEFQTIMQKEYIAGLPLKAKIVIRNAGGYALRPSPLQVKSDLLTPNLQESRLPVIPPFGTKTVEIEFDKTNILTKKDAEFTILYNGETKKEELKVTPVFLNMKGGIALGIFGLIVLALAAKAGRLHIFR